MIADEGGSVCTVHSWREGLNEYRSDLPSGVQRHWSTYCTMVRAKVGETSVLEDAGSTLRRPVCGGMILYHRNCRGEHKKRLEVSPSRSGSRCKRSRSDRRSSRLGVLF